MKHLAASRSVVTELHVLVMQLVAATEAAYGGGLALRLEGGAALAAYHLLHRESEDLVFFGGPGINCADFASAVMERLRGAGLQLMRAGPSNAGFAEFVVGVPDGPDARALKVQIGRNSPFQLEAPISTQEGIRVASYRDLCAGKFHAICDRVEPRDFLDLHAILHHQLPSGDPDPPMRQRFRTLVADLTASDSGLTPPVIGQCLARGLRRDLLRNFPLRLLQPITSDQVHATTELCIDEVAIMVREDWEQRERQSPREPDRDGGLAR